MILIHPFSASFRNLAALPRGAVNQN